MTREPTFNDYTLALRRSRRTVIALALVGAALGALLGGIQSGYRAVVDVEVVDEVELDIRFAERRLSPGQVAGDLSVAFTGAGSARILPGTQTVRTEVDGSSDAVGDEAFETVSQYVDGRRDRRLDELGTSRDFHARQVAELNRTIEGLQQQINDVAKSGGDTVSLQTELVVALGERVNEQLQEERYDTLTTIFNAQLGDPVLVRVERSSPLVFYALVVGLLGVLGGVILALSPSRRSRTVRRLADVTGLVEGEPVSQVVVRGGDLTAALLKLDRAALRLGSEPKMLVLGDGWTPPADALADLVALQGVTVSTATPGWFTKLADGADIVAIVVSGDVELIEAQRVFETLDALGVRTVGVLLAEVPAAEESWARDTSDVEVGS